MKLAKGNEEYRKHGWRFHNGQRKFTETLGQVIGEANVTPWALRNDLAQKDKKGRVQVGGHPRSDFDLAERIASVFKSPR